MLQRLERYFGVPLFVRKRHGVELTKAAEPLLEHARSVLYTMDRMENVRSKRAPSTPARSIRSAATTSRRVARPKRGRLTARTDSG